MIVYRKNHRIEELLKTLIDAVKSSIGDFSHRLEVVECPESKAEIFRLRILKSFSGDRQELRRRIRAAIRPYRAELENLGVGLSTSLERVT